MSNTHLYKIFILNFGPVFPEQISKIIFYSYTIMDRKCPKCYRDFSTDPFWTTSLKRHMKRKNPCDQKDIKYIRELKPIEYTFRHDFNSMEFDHVKPPMDYTLRSSIAPKILKQIFDMEKNNCISWINIKNDDILILQSDKLRHIKLEGLVDLCMLFLHYQVYPTLVHMWTKYEEFKDWLFKTTLIELDNDMWQSEDISKTCEYRNAIRLFLIKHFGRQKSKRRAHRLLQSAETPAVTTQAASERS